MAFTIHYRDSVSFAVELASKLGWRVTHSTNNVDYVKSITQWALHKICEERKVKMVVVNHVGDRLLPSNVKRNAAMIVSDTFSDFSVIEGVVEPELVESLRLSLS